MADGKSGEAVAVTKPGSGQEDEVLIRQSECKIASSSTSPKADNFRVTWKTRDKKEIFHFGYKPGLLSSNLLHEILNQ